MLTETKHASDSGSSPQPSDSDATRMPLIKRGALIVTGLFFVGLGAIGVFLPGIPTAGPLILASICLTKSSPRLERILVRSRFFAPFHKYLDRQTPIPASAKLFAIAVMWISIAASCLPLLAAGSASYGLMIALVVAGGIGTVVIARLRRP